MCDIIMFLGELDQAVVVVCRWLDSQRKLLMLIAPLHQHKQVLVIRVVKAALLC